MKELLQQLMDKGFRPNTVCTKEVLLSYIEEYLFTKIIPEINKLLLLEEIKHWFRIEYKIHFHICYLEEIDKWNIDLYRLPNNGSLNIPFTLQENTYELVLQASIKEAIKLI